MRQRDARKQNHERDDNPVNRIGHQLKIQRDECFDFFHGGGLFRLILTNAASRELQQHNADARHENNGNPIRQIPLKINAVHLAHSF